MEIILVVLALSIQQAAGVFCDTPVHIVDFVQHVEKGVPPPQAVTLASDTPLACVYGEVLYKEEEMVGTLNLKYVYRIYRVQILGTVLKDGQVVPFTPTVQYRAIRGQRLHAI